MEHPRYQKRPTDEDGYEWFEDREETPVVELRGNPDGLLVVQCNTHLETLLLTGLEGLDEVGFVRVDLPPTEDDTKTRIGYNKPSNPNLALINLSQHVDKSLNQNNES